MKCWSKKLSNSTFLTHYTKVILMNSMTTIVAEQHRLQEWAAQIRNCQDRPCGMSVKDWCLQQGITKANYYYRLRRVRQACFEWIPNDMLPKAIVPVPNGLIEAELKSVSQSRLGVCQINCVSLADYSTHLFFE